jgi:hypothetical protein
VTLLRWVGPASNGTSTTPREAQSLTESPDDASLYVWFGAQWYAQTDAILDAPEIHVLEVNLPTIRAWY